MLGVPSLPRNLDAALRDCGARREEVRKSALRDLVRHAEGAARVRVVEAIRQLLRSDGVAELRALTAVACADAGLTEMREDLEAALDDEAPRVVQMALLALGELVERATEAERSKVRTFLDSSLPALRYQALMTTYRWQRADALALLLDATSDEDSEMCWLGFHLLDELEGESARAMSSPLATHRAAVLEKMGEPSMIVGRLRGAAPHVRVEAGLWLLRWAPASAWTLLEPLVLHPKGVEPEQLERLTERFGETGCELAGAWLKRHARRGWFEGRLGWPALMALAKLGDPDAKAAIVEELAVSSVSRRLRALEAIRRLRLEDAVDALETMARSNDAREVAGVADAVLAELRRHSSSA